MFNKVAKMYEYMFVEVSGRKNYTFSPTKAQTTMINNFIKSKEQQIGNNWLFEYFLFQFNRYYDKKTRFGTGIVQLSWVVGKKALSNWKNKKDGETFYVDEFRRKFELKNPLIPKKQLKLSEEYFNIKRKAGNVVECNQLNLYKEKNIVCRFCNNKLICKEL
jgi:hypothetical protein